MNAVEAANVDLFECVVLSALMNGADALRVCADDFASPPNRMIFNCIIGLSGARLDRRHRCAASQWRVGESRRC